MDRITYIYLYNNEGVRYILNRSVVFENIVGQKLMDVLELIGMNTYTKVLYELESELKNISCGVINENSHITILEAHGEWTNVKLCDQKDINIRKKELAKQYDACIVKRDIEIEDADKQISLFVVATIKKILNNIYKTIGQFVNYDLRTTLYNEQYKLKSDIYNVSLKRNQIQAELNELDIKHQEYTQLNNDIQILKLEYDKYKEAAQKFNSIKEEYNYYTTKVDELKNEVQRLNQSIIFLAQKEGRIKANL